LSIVALSTDSICAFKHFLVVGKRFTAHVQQSNYKGSEAYFSSRSVV